jgi:hypothetical protein
MIWHKNQKPMLKSERLRNDRMMQLGCIVSRIRKDRGLAVPTRGAVQCHHIVEGGKRLGHGYTIPLNVWYHLGFVPFQCADAEEAIAMYGASLVHGRPLFIASHGTERELWEMTQSLLGLPADWPESKVLPRRLA